MTAVCVECGNRVHWTAHRGARLADLRCKCGGTLRSARSNWTAPGTTKGRHRVACVVCGRIRIVSDTHRRTVSVVLHGWRRQPGTYFPEECVVEVKAGQFACGYHEQVDGTIAYLREGLETGTLAHPEEARVRIEELQRMRDQAVTGSATPVVPT